MYELRLKQLRKRAGIRTQREMAALVGVNERTYASWEREEVTMSLRQAYDVAVVLGCTLNELVGMPPSQKFSDPREAQLHRIWRGLDRERQDRLLSDARDMDIAKKSGGTADALDGEAV